MFQGSECRGRVVALRRTSARHHCVKSFQIFVANFGEKMSKRRPAFSCPCFVFNSCMSHVKYQLCYSCYTLKNNLFLIYIKTDYPVVKKQHNYAPLSRWRPITNDMIKTKIIWLDWASIFH